MAFNINQFSSNINAYGTLKTSKFDINITPPRILLGTGNISGLIKFRAEQINLPSVNLDLTSVNRYGIGPKQKFATNVSYPETFSISFIEVENGMIQRCMIHWMNEVFNFHDPSIKTRLYYLAQYKDYITTVINVTQYTDDGRLGNIIDILDAFPVNLSVSPLSWAETNTLVKVKVEFAFTEWENPIPCHEEPAPEKRLTDEQRREFGIQQEQFSINPSPISSTPPVETFQNPTTPVETIRPRPIILP